MQIKYYEDNEFQELIVKWLQYGIGSKMFERKVESKKGFWDI